MSNLRVAATIAALSVAVSAGVHPQAAARSADKPPPQFVADTEDPAAPPMDGGAWIIDGGDYAVRVERLDEAGRQEFLRLRTGSSVDPFATRPDQPSGFITFLVQLENSGVGALSLQPLNCWLVGDKKAKVQYPLDLPSILSSYTLMDREMPPAYDTVGKALLDGEVVVAPGQKVTGLLIYRAVSPKTKRYRLELQLTLPTAAVARHSLPYRRSKR